MCLWYITFKPQKLPLIWGMKVLLRYIHSTTYGSRQHMAQDQYHSKLKGHVSKNFKWSVLGMSLQILLSLATYYVYFHSEGYIGYCYVHLPIQSCWEIFCGEGLEPLRLGNNEIGLLYYLKWYWWLVDFAYF